MTAAVLFLWASCLWSIARWTLRLLLAVSPWRRLFTLVVLALTVSCCHKPRERSAPCDRECPLCPPSGGGRRE